MNAFSIQDVTKTFASGDTEEQVLKGVRLTLQMSEVTALVGASGSGKSTLLTIAAGLQKATSGEVRFGDRNLTAMTETERRDVRAREFGFIFQSAHLVPFLTVEEQLLLMLNVSGNRSGKREQKEAVARMLELVEMTHRRSAYPSSLSGGEKQRVAVARALIHQPKILFADEPTASLDSRRSRDVMTLIRDLTKRLGIATLLVTHDEEMLPFADRVIAMKDGLIVRQDGQ
ncbi:ABC transporter ATP-binding protein [Paenibacillus sp. NPDC058071]|uniref:ABC transporter ATP-binding protein n=1 Tax=Paenibacillus sp. NPDC058071 TaxID=3346326 RepID=UPI0036DA3704